MGKESRKITCADCIHEYACQAWNVGHIHDMDARNCVNRETVKDSTAYFLGCLDGKKQAQEGVKYDKG